MYISVYKYLSYFLVIFLEYMPTCGMARSTNNDILLIVQLLIYSSLELSNTKGFIFPKMDASTKMSLELFLKCYIKILKVIMLKNIVSSEAHSVASFLGMLFSKSLCAYWLDTLMWGKHLTQDIRDPLTSVSTSPTYCLLQWMMHM